MVRQWLTGADQSTTRNVWCKSKKSCKDSLEMHETFLREKGRPLFNPQQLAQLEAVVGKKKGPAKRKARKAKAQAKAEVRAAEAKAHREALEKRIAEIEKLLAKG